MGSINNILNRLPEFYNKEIGSNIYAIMSSLAIEVDRIYDGITRLDNMIGIDTTTGLDLDARWGRLTGVIRRSGETDEQYRIRLKLRMSMETGGTVKAIQYAVAPIIGLYDASKLDDQIKIYDTFDYPGELPPGISSDPGGIICIIYLPEEEIPNWNIDKLRADINNAINMNKAAGVVLAGLILTIL